MSNPSVVTLQLVAAIANGIALSQTPAAAGNLTINGSLATAGVATMDVARRVLITSAGADSAVVFTVYGTNSSGAPISSVVTGVASGTPVATALDFKTVTRVAVSGATAGAITVGTNTTASSDWVLDNFLQANWVLSVAVSIASGAVTYTVEHTYDDPNKGLPSLAPAPYQFAVEAGGYVPPLAWPNATLVAKAVNGEAQYANQPIMAHRLTITAGTGLAVMQSIQSGMSGGS